jgi:hypothetical protein
MLKNFSILRKSLLLVWNSKDLGTIMKTQTNRYSEIHAELWNEAMLHTLLSATFEVLNLSFYSHWFASGSLTIYNYQNSGHYQSYCSPRFDDWILSRLQVEHIQLQEIHQVPVSYGLAL